jgi:ABC-type multidrug transport system fused ATPase/permease subunit
MADPAAGPLLSAASARLKSATQGQAPLKRLLALVLAEKRQFARATVWQVLQSLTAIPFVAAVQFLFDHVIPYAQEHRAWWAIAAFAAANIVLWPLHAWASVQAYAHAGLLNRTCVARLRRIVIDQLQHLSLGFYTARGSGAVANQLTVDMGKVEGFLGTVGNGFVPGLTLGLAATVYLLATNPVLAVIALLGVPAQLLILRAMQARVAAHQAKVQAAGESFAARIVEFVAGMRVTKGLGNEDLAAADIGRSIEEIRTTGFDAAITSRWLGLWTQFAWFTTTTLIYAAGGLGIAGFLGVQFTVGQVIAFIGLFGYVQAGAGAITAFVDTWNSARPAMLKLVEVLDSDELEDYLQPKREVALRGEIRLTDVGFSYPRAERVALHPTSLVITAGSRIGLVGETGAGKTTFLDLLMGFYSPINGEVLYDGLPLSEIGKRQLRRRSALMTQDAFLWNTTIRENIRLGRPGASDAEVEAAAQKAQAHDFILRCDRGYETMVGERGSRLSGGQRQRVALARVFLRDPAIVVLDEPTSALDLETEARLQEDLDVLCAGRTTLIVAHRLSTLRNVDRILVFKEGRIIEDGAPADLLTREGGHYRRLHDLQTH